MQTDYNETKDPDLVGLELAVAAHAREIQRRERDAIAQGKLLEFPIRNEHEPKPSAA